MTEEQIDMDIQTLINKGILTENADGTFKFTAQGEDAAMKLFQEMPELYTLVFRDRLN